MRITSEKNGVIHTQIFNLDTIKVYQSTALIDEIRNKISERILGYYPSGKMEFNRRFDYKNEVSEEKRYYPNGALKSEISKESEEMISEIYYAKMVKRFPSLSLK